MPRVSVSVHESINVTVVPGVLLHANDGPNLGNCIRRNLFFRTRRGGDWRTPYGRKKYQPPTEKGEASRATASACVSRAGDGVPAMAAFSGCEARTSRSKTSERALRRDG